MSDCEYKAAGRTVAHFEEREQNISIVCCFQSIGRGRWWLAEKLSSKRICMSVVFAANNKSSAATRHTTAIHSARQYEQQHSFNLLLLQWFARTLSVAAGQIVCSIIHNGTPLQIEIDKCVLRLYLERGNLCGAQRGGDQMDSEIIAILSWLTRR